jgi:hypothetical protein
MSKSDISNESLSEILSTQQLPCFVKTKISKPGDNTDDSAGDEVFYFYKIITTNCFLARYYSSDMQDYLLHHRLSYTASDYYETVKTLKELQKNLQAKSNNITTTTDDTIDKKLFKSIAIIPFNFQGKIKKNF